MKKAILSPLCSAFVIPGLGQIINQHIKKGVCILFAVFVFLAGGIIALSLMIQAVLKQVEINPSKPGVIIDGFRAQDSSALWYLLAAFAVLWLYSVLDAYLAGRKIDQLGKGDLT